MSPSARLVNQVANAFVHHAPLDDSQTERYGAIRQAMRQLAEQLIQDCPESRELSVALTRLEESMMWAIAAIARNER